MVGSYVLSYVLDRDKADQALILSLLMVSLMLQIIFCSGSTSNAVTHNIITWSANVSTLYPPR